MKISDDSEEIFILKTEKIDRNKTVKVEIHNFNKKIYDQENKKEPIISPKFKIGDTSLAVHVYPQDLVQKNSREFIAVYLVNEEEDIITASFTLKHASGVEEIFSNEEIEPDKEIGATEFMSHEAYKEWARNHGDVFQVEVQITLQCSAEWISKK